MGFSWRKFFSLSSKIQIKRRGIKWEIDGNEAIDLCLYFTGEYEPELMRSYSHWAKPGFNVVEIGANCGAHTLPIAKVIGAHGKIVAIEPTDFAFSKLQKNISLNPELSKCIVPFQFFLGPDHSIKKPETISASWSVAHAVYSKERNSVDEGLPCATTGAQVETLDELVCSLKVKNIISKVDALKIDVDGNEIDVLKGATKTLNEDRPVMAIELAPIHFSVRTQKFTELISIINSHGYTIFNLDLSPLPQDAMALEKKIPWGSFLNVLAVPSERGGML